MAFNATTNQDSMHWNNNNSVTEATKTGFPNSPCFQVYGTKRKLAGCSTENFLAENKTSQTKRHCWGVLGTSTHVLSEANPEERNPCNDTAPADIIPSENPSSTDNRVQDSQITPLDKRCQQLVDNLQYMQDMEMESNDYWSPPREYAFKMRQELEEARMLMESDYAPNQAQYQPCSQTPATTHPAPPAQCSYEKTFQVNCYCKPNWDGLLSPEAYI